MVHVSVTVIRWALRLLEAGTPFPCSEMTNLFLVRAVKVMPSHLLCDVMTAGWFEHRGTGELGWFAQGEGWVQL